MKLDFCAICGTKEGLHQHHIHPVVYSTAKRNSKKYDSNKKLKECDIFEIWAYLLDQGYISDDATVTVCEFHHNMLHGIVKFTKAKQSDMIKAGIEKSRQKGIKLGRPSKLNDEMIYNVHQMRKNGFSIRDAARELKIGIGTIYSALNLEPKDLSNEECDEILNLIENDELDSHLTVELESTSYWENLRE